MSSQQELQKLRKEITAQLRSELIAELRAELIAEFRAEMAEMKKESSSLKEKN